MKSEKLSAEGRGPGPEKRALTVWVRMFCRSSQGGRVGAKQDEDTGIQATAGRKGMGL